MAITNTYEIEENHAALIIFRDSSELLRVLIDTEDVSLVQAQKWWPQPTTSSSGRTYTYLYTHYRRSKVWKSSTTLGHWILSDGSPPDPSFKVSYRNGDTLDCRRANLEFLTPATIAARAKVYSRTKHNDLPQGVTRGKGRYMAQIAYEGSGPVYLGSFEDPEEAHLLYAYIAHELRPESYPHFANISASEVPVDPEKLEALIAKVRNPEKYSQAFRESKNARGPAFFKEWMALVQSGEV